MRVKLAIHADAGHERLAASVFVIVAFADAYDAGRGELGLCRRTT